MLYILPSFQVSCGIRLMDLNRRVVANVDGRTYGQTDGQPDPYIAQQKVKRVWSKCLQDQDENRKLTLV